MDNSTEAERSQPADMAEAFLGGDGRDIALKLPKRFGFALFGVPFQATADDSGNGPTISIVGNVCPVPYSAESPARRVELGAFVALVQPPGNVRFAVDRHQMLTLVARGPVPQPTTPDTLVAAAVALLAPPRPYVEVAQRIARLTTPARA
ncbi:MAG: hypothetical protein FJX67_04750 [Alphaproteobacteria bacterium]|nr:hypothetical protein [Alphaproteobacteria bacterium]